MPRNTETQTLQAKELDGEIILGQIGPSRMPTEGFDAARNAISDLDTYTDGDDAAVVTWDTDTKEIVDVQVISP